MAQTPSDREKARFTDVVSFIHAVEDLSHGNEVKLKYSLFDTQHLLIASKTGLGSLYLTVIDQKRSRPMSVEEFDVTELESGEAVRRVVGDAVERFLALEYSDHDTPIIDVEAIDA